MQIMVAMLRTRHQIHVNNTIKHLVWSIIIQWVFKVLGKYRNLLFLNLLWDREFNFFIYLSIIVVSILGLFLEFLFMNPLQSSFFFYLEFFLDLISNFQGIIFNNFSAFMIIPIVYGILRIGCLIVFRQWILGHLIPINLIDLLLLYLLLNVQALSFLIN